MSELKDTILTNVTSRRMVANVSPIYDNSYIGLWVFEAMGREYEEAWELTNTLPDQLFPETATWGLVLWEQRYRIPIDLSMPIEERRLRVVTKRSIPRPLNPMSIEVMLFNITERHIEYHEHTGPYTFGVYLLNSALPSGKQVDYDAILALIRKHKQAHKSFDFAFQSDGGAVLSMEGRFYTVSPYLLSGQARVGESILR